MSKIIKNKFLKTELFDGVEIYTIDGVEYMRHKLSNGFLSLMDIEEFALSVIDFTIQGKVKFALFIKEERGGVFTIEDTIEYSNELLYELDLFFIKMLCDNFITLHKQNNESIIDDIFQNKIEMEKFMLESEEYEKLEYLKKLIC